MNFSPIARAITLATAGSVLLAVPTLASAAFIEDSTANLGFRNLYMNQDTRHVENTPQNKNANKTKEEWSQAFILDYKSGFTEGTIGVGVDIYAATAIKLDSGPYRTPDSFPQRSNGKSVDNFGKLGGTFKAKVSETVLQVGTLKPRLPMLQANLEGRILPQLFTGGMITSNEINGLTATLGHIDRVNQRASTNRERMEMNVLGKGLVDKKTGEPVTGKTRGNYTSNSFDLANLNYKWNDQLSTGYSFGRLEDLYKQHIINAVYVLPLGDQRSLRTDVRASRSTSDGDVRVDNKAFSGMVTYNFGFNKLGLGYQKMTGDTGYAYVQGSDPFLVNYVANREFGAKDEKSWQVRHDYNFAGLGIPGLTMFNRYVKGTGADLGRNKPEGREWERDFDISYAFQEGALKNFNVRWRNSTVRSNINKDLDDNRLILAYTLPLL
ncbi:OprD family porin [Denitrificimonas caeni]|uniref:OprD family porin n=1 Tax=Denitrificimonas caeni TaxID=521720 RepID=A0AAE9VT02_9GAMM|nr:OprD family porin [Denitrificimonas caeni]NLJ13128.1 OprD family porin [Gammaproteobacteria bacterium]WBE24421.1 OprD family porin [Denitrificimonas caeni]